MPLNQEDLLKVARDLWPKSPDLSYRTKREEALLEIVAELVSRQGGYLMSEVAKALEDYGERSLSDEVVMSRVQYSLAEANLEVTRLRKQVAELQEANNRALEERRNADADADLAWKRVDELKAAIRKLRKG